jgi:hypothetical protein
VLTCQFQNKNNDSVHTIVVCRTVPSAKVVLPQLPLHSIRFDAGACEVEVACSPRVLFRERCR